MNPKLFLIACLTILSVTFFACSSPDLSDANHGSTPTPSPAPKPKPTPEKKETVWTCKISNGAGRIFHATHESRVLAEANARHECQIYSRNCILLDCSAGDAD